MLFQDRRMLVVALMLVSALGAACSSGEATTVDEPSITDDVRDDGSGGVDLNISPADTFLDSDYGFELGDGFFGQDGEVFDSCLADPGSFGCPCAGNDECLSGFCVSSILGPVCTQECLEECPDAEWECVGTTGFGADIIFLCIPAGKEVCTECQTDVDCPEGRCLNIGGEMKCSYPCSGDKECPPSYGCENVMLPGGGDLAMCFPMSGFCDCVGSTSGNSRPCGVENEFGSCAGVEVCDPESGWTDCSAKTPEQEICDGQDNNCDGDFDEGLPDVQICSKEVEGVGTCAGSAVCMGAEGWVCNAPKAKVEICDYKDNDCDGLDDEGFQVDGKYVVDEHCGSCNQNCDGALPNAESFCNPGLVIPQCVVSSCAEGFYKANDFQCLPLGQTQCKPCFNDASCQGGICEEMETGSYCLNSCEDEGCPEYHVCGPVDGKEGEWCIPQSEDCGCTVDNSGVKRPCSSENESGLCFGQEICDPTQGWVGCTAPEAMDEICDGFDNDCNGIPDDDILLGEVCEVDVPDVGICVGSTICLGEAGWACSAQEPQPEKCDYLDNDCDGDIDESFLVDGEYATLHHCGSCNKDCEGTLPNAEAYCDASGAKPVCKVEQCAPGYYQLNEFQCIDPPGVQCAECESDDDCYFDVCAPTDHFTHCLRPCPNGNECDDGYSCDDSDGLGSLCYPDSGSCECQPENEGLEWSCSETNGAGTCFGKQICGGESGWSDCDAKTPVQEMCNGIDDDCDGLIDEDLTPSKPCDNSNEFGTCSGISYCMGTPGWVCQADTPAAELCDYQDNDCDGTVDEDYQEAGKYFSDLHCGTCNNACAEAIPFATGSCNADFAQPKCVVDNCHEGYIQVSPFQCIVPPETTCQACEEDADCLGSLCLTIDGEQRCAKPCEGAEDCLGETACAPSDSGTVCLPLSGSCECNSFTAGSKRTCAVSNEVGTCFGFETCDAIDGWSECDSLVPSEETCNGIDDDCNGQIDEELPDTLPCDETNEFGSCDGFAICLGTPGWVCQSKVPSAEICDFQDNNCDGTVDEGFVAGGKYDQVGHCGTCNNSCVGSVSNATEACDSNYPIPKCVVDSCDDGYFQISPFQCIVPPDTTCQACNGDEDCLGGHCITVDGEQRCAVSCQDDQDCGAERECVADVQAGAMVCVPTSGSCTCSSFSEGAKRSCSSANGIGTCFGFETCDAEDGWSDCDALLPALETCDGIDNDCSGLIDDDLPATELCSASNEFGTCEGVASCLGLAGWVCQAAEPAAETCDYVDNNCNGMVDEDFVDGEGQYTEFSHCGSCSTSCESGFPNAVAKCDASLDTPKCTVESCDDGYFKLNEFQCIPNTAGLCESCSSDDNCVLDGAKCVQLSDGMFCSKECQNDGECPAGYTCETYGNGKQCLPVTNSCDCDGSNPNLSRSCSQTWPVDPGPGEPFTACYGAQGCEADGWSDCVLPDEVCDGIDNDCNGVIDDFFLVGGKYSGDTNCGQCGNNCTFFQYPNANGVCDGDKQVPDCTMECEAGFFDINDNPGDGCECAYQGETDHPDGIDQNCDGVDGELENGIFVAKNGSDGNSGTISKPKLTVQAAIDAAFSGGQRDVYVATGVYSASIVLKSGVRVYGGYSSDFLTRDILLYETVIIGSAFTVQKPGAVNAISITGAPGSTVLSGFTIFGKNNNSPGGSSYAIYVRGSTNALSIADNTVESGVAGNGAKGSNGVNGSLGSPGSGGASAFGAMTSNCNAIPTNFPRLGGTGGLSTCDGGDLANGGSGGGNTCPPVYNAGPVAFENGVPGVGASAGDGGVGGYDREVWYCFNFPGGECHQATGGNEVGNAGESGGAGSHGDTNGGNGCSADDAGGLVVAGLWQGGSGLSGFGGSNGSGGGGGGAGGGAQDGAGCSDRTQIGGAGGGGGSGGCGGTGGGEGGSGGGVFGLFITWDAPPASAPSVANNTFYGGVGGAGGAGGNAGSGGAGGDGGAGGAEDFADAKCAANGGAGGNGGHGGHGEGGGGGCGGSSFALYANGQGGTSLAAYKNANAFVVGAGGNGGSGGPSIGQPGDAGSSGLSGATNL
jgi:hypothetical protein